MLGCILCLLVCFGLQFGLVVSHEMFPCPAIMRVVCRCTVQCAPWTIVAWRGRVIVVNVRDLETCIPTVASSSVRTLSGERVRGLIVRGLWMVVGWV